MGFFSKHKQQPDKQTPSLRRPYAWSSSSTSESPVSPNKLVRPDRAAHELSGQAVKRPRHGDDNAAPVAKPNTMLELENARQRAHIRELQANEEKLKQAVAFSAHIGIRPDFRDISATKSNASAVSLPSPPPQQRKDSGVAPSLEDSLAQAPEVVVRGMHPEFGTRPSTSGSSMQVSTHEGAGSWRQESPTVPVQHTTQQHQQQSQQFPPQPQAPAFDIAKAIVSISTLPWSKALATLAESSSNPGLLLLLLVLLYFTYSIIMTRAMYLLLAFGIGIVVHHASKSFFVAKQAELQSEYMRSIASNLQTVEFVPPDVNSSRLLLPAGMNRVDELN